MAYCTTSDFKDYPLSLPTSGGYSEKLKGIIKYLEAKYLDIIFTEEYLAAYTAWVGDDKTKAEGYLKEMLKCFIYFQASQAKSVDTPIGQLTGKPENNTEVLDISKITMVYNDGVRYYNKFKDLLNSNNISHNNAIIRETNEFGI